MAKKKDSAEKAIRDIRRATRRRYSAEEKIRIVLEGLRGESSIAELCRKEGINQNLYYRWSKEFLEAGKKRLAASRRGRRHARDLRLAGIPLRMHARSSFWPAFQLPAHFLGVRFKTSTTFRLFVTAPRFGRGILLWRPIMATGTVKFFDTNKGFGFIQPESGEKDVFVHISAVQNAGMDTLTEGQRISYEVVTERGKLAASNLKAA
jgi:cold shock CspA family protein/transposase-like protein